MTLTLLIAGPKLIHADITGTGTPITGKHANGHPSPPSPPANLNIDPYVPTHRDVDASPVLDGFRDVLLGGQDAPKKALPGSYDAPATK
jgi:hypothetical protein